MYKEKKLLNLLTKNNCIHYQNDDNIQLSSGISSNVYYDIKKAAGFPDLFEFIIEQLQNIIPKNSSIVAVSTGGIPNGAALANIYKTNFAYVRENKKKYGMENLIEGYIDYKKPIYIIDDVCTSGKSLINTMNTIKKTKEEVKDFNLVCILDRSNSKLEVNSVIKIK